MCERLLELPVDNSALAAAASMKETPLCEAAWWALPHCTLRALETSPRGCPLGEGQLLTSGHLSRCAVDENSLAGPVAAELWFQLFWGQRCEDRKPKG